MANLEKHYQYLTKINKLLRLRGTKAQSFAKKNKINVNKLYPYRKDLSAQETTKETLLHYIVYKYHRVKLALLKKLIKKIKDNKGRVNTEIVNFLAKNTRFYFAFRDSGYLNKYMKLISFCIKTLKSDLNIENSNGQNVFSYALSIGVIDLAYYIDKFYSNRYSIDTIIDNSELVSVAYYNDLANFINESIDQLNPNKLYNNRISLLNFSCCGIIVGSPPAPLHFITDNIKVSEALLKRGANPNYRLERFRGRTILHVAGNIIWEKNIEEFTKVLKLYNYYNFDFDIQDYMQMTILHYILNSYCRFVKGKKINKYYLQSIELAIKQMNNPNAVDYRGLSVIDHIMEHPVIWNKIKGVILSPDYKPFIDLCKRHIERDTMTIDNINIPKKDKLEILFQLTKKYYCDYYLDLNKEKDIIDENINGLTFGGNKRKESQNLEKLLFKDLSKHCGKLLYSICQKSGKDKIKNYALYSKRMNKIKNKKVIKTIIKKINDAVSEYAWCKFDFVDQTKLGQYLLQTVYLGLREYTKLPIDESIDILFDPKTKQMKKRYVFTTGAVHDQVFGLTYLYKKHKKLLCPKMFDNLVNIYSDHITDIYSYSFTDVFSKSHLHYNIDINKIFNIEKWTGFIKQCMNNRTKRFTADLITLKSWSGSHSNALLIDNKNKTIERFEPHGSSTSFYDMNKFDTTLRKLIKTKLSKQYTYLGPKDIESEFGPQGLSQEGFQYKIGDPGGYCMTWSLSYLDLRLSNPTVNPHKLYDKVIDIIHAKGLRIVDYIRLYTKIAYRLREDILEAVGINYDDLLAVNLTNDQGKKIIKLIKANYT